MLKNPFTPSQIASNPEDFFGRSDELRQMERSLCQGSVIIQGPIGIGKSSLLSRVCSLMEGFDSEHQCPSAVAVGHKGIRSSDEAARLVLESFANIDQRTNKIKLNLGSVFEIESSEVCSVFAEGRHLASLVRLLEKKYINMMLKDQDLLILAIDEADKCPVPLAQMIRVMATHLQQIGVENIRFILAGVSPFFQAIADEDTGVTRFFYKIINLEPMKHADAEFLVRTKFKILCQDAESQGINLTISPLLIDRMISLSGGHPHILQLLGSHLIEHENEEPDGVIDELDLINSLRTICYEDRAHAYTSALHFLETNSYMESFRALLTIASGRFPTRIDRETALLQIDSEILQWFVDNNFLLVLPDNQYGLADEFLRVRVILDEEESADVDLERRMIETGAVREIPLDEYDSGRQMWGQSYNSDEEW